MRRSPRVATSTSASEEFRRAALALVAAGRQARFQTAALSSARRGEGTTSAILQIARHMMSDAALRPVVIELNAVRPALERRFSLDPRRTLSTLMTTGGAAAGVVQHDADGLAMIPAGETLHTAGSQPGTLEAVLCRAIRELQESYDFVLIDAPPILESADVLIAGRVAPQLVLVVGAGQASHEDLGLACQQLDDARITLVGSVLVSRRRFLPIWVERLLG